MQPRPASPARGENESERKEGSTMRKNIFKLVGVGAALVLVAWAAGNFGSDVASGQQVRTLTGHTGSVTSVAFSPDGRLLASGSWDNTIKLWDVATGSGVLTLSGTGSVNSVAFSPDGRLLASGSCARWDGYFCVEGEIKLWEVATGREVRTLREHAFAVYSVAFSPDGWLLASGSCEQFGPEGCSGVIDLWEVATGNLVGTLIDWRTSDVNSVAFSPDGQLLASGSCRVGPLGFGCVGGMIDLWDVATGSGVLTLYGHAYAVTSVAFSPDGRLLASGGSATIDLWDVATGNLVRTLEGHTGGVSEVVFSPDGRLLASGSCARWDGYFCREGEIKLWEVATGSVVRTLTGHTDTVRSVAFSPDGQLLASGSDDRTIKLWDLSGM